MKGRKIIAAASLVLCAASFRPEAPVSSLALRDLEGRKVALADYRGKSPVLVFFFRGFWCAYCVEQLVQLERLRASDLKDVPVLVVSPETVENSRKGKAALEKEKSVRFTLRFLTDPDVKFALHYGLGAEDGKREARRPSFVLVDRDGKEVWSYSESHYMIRPLGERLREGLKRLGQMP